MPLNGKFTEKYGKSWENMDRDARDQALMSELFDLRDDVSPMKTVCKTVDRHTVYFTILWIILTMVAIPTLLLAIKTWWNL
jgi:hypothetical protein